MNNKLLKKVILIAIMILGILSTSFVNAKQIDAEGRLIDAETYYNYGQNPYAHPYMRYENSMIGRLQIESLGGSAKYNEVLNNNPGPTVITAADLKEYYDILCREKGRALPGNGSTYLSDGTETLSYSYPDLTEDDIGTTIDAREGEEGHIWTNKSLARYLLGAKHRCTPKEAYILAEMINNVSGGGGEEGSDIIEIDFEAGGREVEWAGLDDSGRDTYRYKDTGELVPPDVEVTINENGINSGYSYVQYAWWATSYGHTGNTIPDTVFSTEGQRFQEYIKDVATNQAEMDSYISMSPDAQDALGDSDNIIQKVFRQEEVEHDDGTKKTYDYAFDITYEPKWVEEIDEVYVGYDEDKDEFVIGPLKLDYVEAGSEGLTGREDVLFAGIIGMELYTNISEEPLVRGTDWDMTWKAGDKRTADDDFEYPHSGEEFWVTVKNQENLTKITNIKTHFKYMNASGECNRLNGTYNIGTWEQILEEAETEDGEDEWYIECTDVQENNKSQNLTLGVKAARWYKYVDLDRELEVQYGKLRIYKDVVDQDGNKLNTGDWFKFTVAVSGALNSEGDETVWVKAGSFTDSKTYYWLKEQNNPSFEVSEPESSAYFRRGALQLIGMEGTPGTLKHNDTVKVIATNRAKPNEGDLQIVKELYANHYTSQSIGGTFTFNVSIYTDTNLPFYVNGQRYTSENDYHATVDVNVSVSSPDEIQSALSDKIHVSWYGTEAPKYFIKEVSSSNPNITLDTSAKTGTLAANTIIKTEPARNRVEVEKAQLNIIKKLKSEDAAEILTIFSKEYIDKMEWKFTVKVDGYKDTEVVLRTAKWQEDGSVVWEYTTDYYYWSKGETRNYTITEHDNPDGTEFAGVDAGSDGSASGTSVTGTLKSNKDTKYLLTNIIINKVSDSKSTRLHVTKNVDYDMTENTKFQFAITLKGTFLYNGILYKDTTVQLTTDADADHTAEHKDKIENGLVVLNPEQDHNEYHFVNIEVDASSKVGEWTSPEIKWYGDAPKFNVDENLLGEDIQATIIPKSGTLVGEAGNNFEIKAINSIPGVSEGYIHIIKTVENVDKLSAEYIKNLNFVFDVEVDGYPKTTVIVEAEQKGNSWVWEWTSPAYTWKKGESAPNYIVTEKEDSDFNILSTNPLTGTLKESTVEEMKANNGKLITTDVEVINQAKERKGDLTIVKELEANSNIKDGGIKFTFDVEIKGNFTYAGVDYHSSGENPESCKIPAEITLTSTSGEWKSGEITWYGGDAPKYEVKERESEEAKIISLLNASGTVQEGTGKTIATAINKANEDEAYIEIVKQIDNEVSGENFNDNFTFTIKVEGHEEETVTVKANQVAKFGPYKWDATSNPPKYEVTEINLPEGTTLVSITNESGTLAKDETVTVVAKNKYEEHTDKFRVKKAIIIDEKLLDLVDLSGLQFTMRATVSGTFKYGGEVIENGSKTVEFSLAPDGVFESDSITWYGNNEPTVTVREINLPKGWQNVGISNNGAILSTEGTLEIVVTNKIDIVNRMELTMELGGLVWEEWIDETSKNTEYSQVNNVYDQGLDFEKAGVEVYVYDKDGNLETLYNDTLKGEITQPIITGNDGLWEARLKLNKLKLGYYVEFVYDGQTYKTVEPLVSGDAGSYKNASDKSPWVNNSMASDKNRDEVNSKLATIEGLAPIQGNGNTTGTAVSEGGEKNTLEYTSMSIEEGSARRISKLQTLNADGTAKNLFRTTASTLQVGLTYPFNKQISLVEAGGFTLTELGYEQYYIYTATQDYMKHINLGLVKRPDVDMGVTKDLVSAKVVVNERLMEYTFNGLADIIAGDDENRVRTIQSQAMNLSYELGLYQTEYYYRAELYKVLSANGYQTLTEGLNAYTAVENFYKSLGGKIEDTEMEVYLTYKMSLYNETSQSYDIIVHKLMDYYDSSFELITEDEYKYIKEKNNTACDRHSELVASKPENNWVQEDGIITGSDGRTYKKMVLNEDINLSDGTARELKVTFKVKKDTIDGVKDSIILGTKTNVIEIGSYTTKDKDGKIAGRVDTDSAPDNVNISRYNEKTWYEDDTDSAPELDLKIEDMAQRSLSGIAWEDKKEGTEGTGNGIYDSGDEALIGGLTTELLEKVEVDGKEYDFLWPTNKPLAVFSGKSIEELTGFDSTVETSRTVVQNDEGETTIPVGGYEFTSVPAGNFMVRFIYGNDKTDLSDMYGTTGLPEALKEDGSNFYGNRDHILTAGYHRDAGLIDAITGRADKFGKVVEDVLAVNDVDTYTEVNTSAVYNGQDYKSTLYKVGGNHDSEARDDEAKRLEVIAESETITNINGNVLITANTIDAKHTELFNNYWMFADTEKYEMPTITLAEGSSDLVSKDNGNYSVKFGKYEVKDVDFGLIQRPENQIILDKQIKSIKLITNDNNVIFDAEYDISYKLENNYSADDIVLGMVGDKYIVAKAKLNNTSIATDLMQALDKAENKLLSENNDDSIKNFRFINIDDSILQGTTIDIEYQLTAINAGEKDYTLAEYETLQGNTLEIKAKLLEDAKAVKEAKTNNTYTPGAYVGEFYYTGTPGANEVPVTVRVRQLVEYVDNDAVFTAAYNDTTDHSWRNSTVTELVGSGFESQRLLDLNVTQTYDLIDVNGMTYITDQRNNVILSEDSLESTDKNDLTVRNNGFERKLSVVEGTISEENASQITLRVTRTIAAAKDTDDLTFDNLAEIVKFENTVGRRDTASVPGNANPHLGEFETALYESDSSSTELITFTPPTGLEVETGMTFQILLITVVALGIIVVGIVIIKKKVL